MKKQFIRQWTLLLLFALAITPAALAQKTGLERVHENVRVTPYPQQDNPLYLNPSPLIVPVEMRKADYLEFQLSQEQTFPKGKILQSKPLAWCMFNPHRVLENGTWYWRFRSVDKAGKAGEWSATYNFSVSEDIPQFVTPTFDAFMKNMPKGYPRIYCFLEEGLKKAKGNIQTSPEYKDLTNRAQRALNNNYETHPTPYKAANLMGQDANQLYTAYRATGEQRYADKMLAYTRALLASTPDPKLINDFYCGDVLFLLTHTYDACYDRLNREELQKIEDLTFQIAKYHHNVQRKGRVENHIFDNHYWQRAYREMLQIGLMFADKNDTAKEILEYCYELWTARAPASGFNRDGEWHNGQGYFHSNVKTLWYVPSLMSYVTGTDFLQHPWYKSTGRSLVYTWPPHSKSSGFGDGSEQGDEPARQRVAFADFLARELNDSYAGWYASECDDTMQGDRLFRLYRMCSTRRYDTSLPADAAKMVWYEDTGEVTMHSCLTDTEKDVNLSFRSSTFGSGSHTTSSQNAFNLLFKGKEIYRSSGYYLNFNDAHNLMSYRHSRAHNTILVNGIGQPYSTRGYGNIMRTLEGAHITYCLGDASKAYCGISDDPMWVQAFERAGITQTPENGFGETPLTKYRRHVLMLHPEGIVLIYDELEASEPVTYDWLLHSPSQLSLNKELLTINHADYKSGYTVVTQLFCNNPVSMSLTDRFLVNPDPATMKAGETYPNQWHMTARIEREAKTRILAVIQVNAGNTAPQIIRKTGGTLTVGKWTINVELDASRPAALNIIHSDNPVHFSYGKESPTLNGVLYPREHSMSSLLYDETGGEYKVVEVIDQLPASTRIAR